MRPRIELDADAVRENFLAWRRFSGVRVLPVIKANGYNWGFAALVQALDDLCDGYCVADADELFDVRALTSRPITVLGAVAPAEMAAVLDAGGVPNVSTQLDLDAVMDWCSDSAQKPLVRVGVRPAVGWTGMDLPAISRLAPALAVAGVRVRAWGHVVSRQNAADHLREVDEAVHALQRAGVMVDGCDVASSHNVERGRGIGDAVRVGVGLFGSCGPSRIPGVRCALRVKAPVVAFERVSAGTTVGYASTVLQAEADVVTARCGYSDGLAETAAGWESVLSVGMQYVNVKAEGARERSTVSIIDESTDLDAFSSAVGRSAHEVVCQFGPARGSRRFATIVV